MKFIVTMPAEIDIEIEANSPQEARDMARNEYCGDMDYIHDITSIFVQNEIKYVTDEDGNEY